VNVSNVLSEAKRKQVIALGQLGWTLRRIQGETGVRRETAAGYLKAAGITIRSPGRWGRRRPAIPAAEMTTDPSSPERVNEVTTDPEPSNPANGVITDSASPKPAIEVTTDFGAETGGPLAIEPEPTRSPSASASGPFHELIEAGLSRGRNARGIWQDLVDQSAFTGSYESVKRYVRKLRGAQSPEPRAVIITAPGEEGQVDYGDGPMVRDLLSGKYRRARLFVMTLGYSRKSVRLLTFQSSTQIWAELHERAFRRLGGAVRVVVLDNLREGVLTPDIYDPSLNPLYRDVLAHYGAVALACRVGDPDRKGKVESGVGHAKRTPLKGQRFESLEQAQTYLDHWEQRWADTRIHGTTKRQVAAMFAEEKPVLLPLPLEPFRYYQFGERTVHLDGCVEIEAAYYSAPPRWIGRRVQVQWNAHQVRLLDPKTGELLREHRRQERGRHRIHDEDRPKRTPLGTLELLARAAKTGQHIGAFCKQMHDQQGQPAVRRMQGVLSFLKKYGVARVEEVCAIALDMEVYSYQFVRRYLERNAQPPLSLRQVDPLIRQLTLYRDLIQERTKETTE
jgi:transposase